MTDILLFISRRSRRGAESAAKIHTSLQDAGFHVLNSSILLEEADFENLLTTYKNQARAVVIGGGDGAINHCLPALLKSEIPLHVVPLGTANNLARTLAIPANLEANIKVLQSQQIGKVDVGVVNDRPFLNVAGIGLSTIVNREVTRRTKSILGPLAFVYTAFRTVPKLRPFKVEIEHSDGIHKARSWQVTICNGRHYGSGFTIQKDASLNDGLLDCVSCEMRKWWHGFLLIPSLFFGRPANRKTLTHIRSRRFVVRTKKRKKIDVDGDIRTGTPAIFEVRLSALKIVLP